MASGGGCHWRSSILTDADLMIQNLPMGSKVGNTDYRPGKLMSSSANQPETLGDTSTPGDGRNEVLADDAVTPF
eukprot:scaffold84868_cov44-Prasinocladus_malaysianus.AAC.3